MYFLVFLAHPKPSHPEYGRVDGAYVACWVNDPIEAAADAAARDVLETIGWDVAERDEAYPLADDHYAQDQDGYARVQEARENGVSVVIHNWPVGAADEDE